MANLLIVDDDGMIGTTMSRIFSDIGHKVLHASTLSEGLERVFERKFDIVFLDVKLPDGDGLSRLNEFRKAPSNPEIIILTGFADSDGAEIAIKNNAWDYIRKPASIDTLTLSLNRALQYRKEKTTNKPPVNLIRNGIIGNSPGIRSCLDLVARAADSDANILITGETGTGKELFSRAIHINSSRADKKFAVVDCSSLPETLIESLLFGHMKGAFTGAVSDREGMILQANEGTLFLDEVGELSLSAQKTLLRVLQEKRFQPIGSTREVESDFRLVAATNKNIEKMAAIGTFRDDLLFRLKAITIHLPPLRERTEDIRDLAIHYMSRICEKNKIGMKGFSPDFLQIIRSYSWPGNIRELQGALEWAVAQALYEPTLFPKHLPENIRIKVARSSFQQEKPDGIPEKQVDSTPVIEKDTPFMKWKDYRKSIIDKAEEEYFSKIMRQANGSVKSAAHLSGLSKPRIYELLRKYGLLGR